ncbi:MAG TPA: RNA ligase family protein [Gemmataceae bacterium]|nr:RNA ligase family protein [Gemmataceae bacterium]
MLYYPKIPGSRNAPLGRCVAFEKYDGTNLHWDWDREFGWHSFGTRRDEFMLADNGMELFKLAHAHLHECVPVFVSTLATGLDSVFKENSHYQSFNSVRAFTEFIGPNSFAGLHKTGERKRLVLFDVLVEPFGMIGPEQFVADFGHLPSARVVYRGKLTGKFSEDVRQGKYDVNEGVVCKGGVGGSDLWMAKIKTNAYWKGSKQPLRKTGKTTGNEIGENSAMAFDIRQVDLGDVARS